MQYNSRFDSQEEYYDWLDDCDARREAKEQKEIDAYEWDNEK